MLLFEPILAPAPDGIDLRHGCVTSTLEGHGATLVHADPPWSYAQKSPQREGSNPPLAGADEHYGGLTPTQIAEHIHHAGWEAPEAARLIVWCTWPLLPEWMAEHTVSGGTLTLGKWRLTTGGAWCKTDARMGQGYHWRGDSEFVLIYTKGSTGRPHAAISNACTEPRTQHSEKPVSFIRSMVRAWTQPGDRVLDMYAGMAPMARACAAEGRGYLGAELDENRHRDARARLAQMIGVSDA